MSTKGSKFVVKEVSTLNVSILHATPVKSIVVIPESMKRPAKRDYGRSSSKKIPRYFPGDNLESG